MKTVITDISYRHYDLIRIFFEANELLDLGFTLDIVDIESPLSYSVDGREYIITNVKKVLSYSYDAENVDAAGKIMHMSIKHLGFTNMLHDYLNRCGYTVSQHVL